MTWSILARDADGSFGAAIASRFFAVGALWVHTRRGDDHAAPIEELRRLHATRVASESRSQ